MLPVDERHLYPEVTSPTRSASGWVVREAERLILGRSSAVAANDLAGATRELASRMVREYGMSPRLGPVGFSSDDPSYLGDSSSPAGSTPRRPSS